MRCSVVVPCYNEEATLPELHRRLSAVLPTVADDYEIILVDDGSTDGTLAVMRDLAAGDPHVRYVSFSRNFGHEAASTAGLDRADGDCVILMDADLQDPPEVIPDLVNQWQQGYEEVHAARRRQSGLNPIRRLFNRLFYRSMSALTAAAVPPAVGNFRLMDRTVVEALRQCRERGRWVCGLISWVGFRQTRIEYDRPKRFAGRGKYRARQLLHLAMDAVTGASIAPLRIASLLGLCVALVSLGVALGVVIRSLVRGLSIPGAALTAAGLFFLGGVQMLLLGVMGEYVGRTYRQVQARPLYLVREEGGEKKRSAVSDQR